jgi:hypothetical protein
LVSFLIRHKDGGGEKYNFPLHRPPFRSAFFMADGGFGGLRKGLKGGLLSPPVFKEGLGVVFPLLSKSDNNSAKSANGGFNHYSK